MVDYVCPLTKENLTLREATLVRRDGFSYPMVTADVPNFLAGGLTSNQINDDSYDAPNSVEIYRNFLNWMFKTFAADETEFRKGLVRKLRLQPGQSVLVTGCGLGEDLPLIAEQIGAKGRLFAQDLSRSMVLAAQTRFNESCNVLKAEFSVGNAQALPYRDGAFDAVFHFGGINFFGDMATSIAEMARVTKVGGRVVFGDESVAPWLRDLEYGEIAIANNRLWASPLPLEALPPNCEDVNCTWVLGNCFYVIDFKVLSGLPFMDIDVPHLGRRGGSARTRYFGQLEGVSAKVKVRAREAAKREGVSLHDWLERVILKSADT